MEDARDPNHPTPGAPRPAAPSDRVAALEGDLAAAQEELRQANDKLLRERADAENLKKRAARERADAIRFGTEGLIKDLLPIVDNLDRAVQHARGAGEGQSLIEGVALVLKSLLDTLARHGVTRVEAVAGTGFDPTHHEAVAHIESAEHPSNAVVQEHQPGYRLHDRLLRPALVTVSKGASNLANPAGGD